MTNGPNDPSEEPQASQPSHPATPREKLAALRERIELRTKSLHTRHRSRLHCEKGCCDCCVDGIEVFEVEAQTIRDHHPKLLETGLPHTPGKCAFLDEQGACRIYAHRPYVCRNQGLPLRWLDEDDQGNRVEYRDLCPLNEEGEPLEKLDPRDCWTLGPVEGELAQIQRAFGAARPGTDGDRPGARVSLRSLFARDLFSQDPHPSS